MHRADIPVIIMGETGCGKTMLIEYMSQIQVPKELQDELSGRTTFTMKVCYSKVIILNDGSLIKKV